MSHSHTVSNRTIYHENSDTAATSKPSSIDLAALTSVASQGEQLVHAAKAPNNDRPTLMFLTNKNCRKLGGGNNLWYATVQTGHRQKGYRYLHSISCNNVVAYFYTDSLEKVAQSIDMLVAKAAAAGTQLNPAVITVDFDASPVEIEAYRRAWPDVAVIRCLQQYVQAVCAKFKTCINKEMEVQSSADVVKMYTKYLHTVLALPYVLPNDLVDVKNSIDNMVNKKHLHVARFHKWVTNTLYVQTTSATWSWAKHHTQCPTSTALAKHAKRIIKKRLSLLSFAKYASAYQSRKVTPKIFTTSDNISTLVTNVWEHRMSKVLRVGQSLRLNYFTGA